MIKPEALSEKFRAALEKAGPRANVVSIRAVDLPLAPGESNAAAISTPAASPDAATPTYTRQDASNATPARQPSATSGVRRVRKMRMPNRIEALFNTAHLGGAGHYEGLRFKLAGGHWYSPDWIACRSGVMVVAEVKDGRRHHFSHQRSRLAFDTARAAWSWLGAWWVWAEYDGDKFQIETFDNKESPRE